MFDFSAFAEGLALGLGIFVCPGPKDLLVLQHALRRRPAGELLAIAVGSDALLIALGMAGISLALAGAPVFQRAAMWLGVGLLLWHAAAALRRCLARNEAGPTLKEPVSSHLDRQELLLTSLLHPVAWMDTVLVIGAAGALLPQGVQLSFGAGALAASASWFACLTVGARYMARWLARPSAWRAMDASGAVAMILLALYLARGLV